MRIIALFMIGPLVLTGAGSYASLATAQTTCAALDRAACTSSPACISVLSAKKLYQCQQIINACQAFRQSRFMSDGTPDMDFDAKADCEARSGCAFVPAGPCYCPPGVTCFCGGGPPSDCVPVTDSQ